MPGLDSVLSLVLLFAQYREKTSTDVCLSEQRASRAAGRRRCGVVGAQTATLPYVGGVSYRKWARRKSTCTRVQDMPQV